MSEFFSCTRIYSLYTDFRIFLKCCFSMRARIITFLFLVFFISIPVFAYWYFMVRTQSLITFNSAPDTKFNVELHGTFSYKYLPLADTFLSYNEECITSCTLWPLPPALYKITISSSGNVRQESEWVLASNEEKKVEYRILKDITILPIEASSENITQNIPSMYTFLTAIWERKLVVSQKESWSSLGFLISDVYRPIMELSRDEKDIGIDGSSQFIILQKSALTHILSTDFVSEVDFPLQYGIPKYVTFQEGIWKVQAPSWLYERDSSGKWEKNMRFSDYIDITPDHRLGYISASDTQLLTLNNLPSWNGVFVILDRVSWESYIVRDSFDIRWFFYESGIPMFHDESWEKYSIQLHN